MTAAPCCEMMALVPSLVAFGAAWLASLYRDELDWDDEVAS